MSRVRLLAMSSLMTLVALFASATPFASEGERSSQVQADDMGWGSVGTTTDDAAANNLQDAASAAASDMGWG